MLSGQETDRAISRGQHKAEQHQRTKSIGGTNDIDLFPAVKAIKLSQQLINNVHFIASLNT